MIQSDYSTIASASPSISAKPMPQLNLRFAPSLEELFEDVVQHRPLSDDPFQRSVMITGGPGMWEWFNRKWAEHFGVAADFEHASLESCLWNSLKPVDGITVKGVWQAVEFLRPEVLQCAILKQLTKTNLEKIRATPLLTFLHHGEVLHPTRKVDIASRLAQLFLDYERQRPEIFNRSKIDSPLESLLKGDSPPWLSETETWQRQLWDAVFCEGGLMPPNDAGIRPLSLPQLFILRKNERNWTPADSERPLCLFGITKPSIFHRWLILQLSMFRDVQAWLTNPCSEFWEDVTLGKIRHWKANDAQVAIPHYADEELQIEYFDPEPGLSDHRLLQLWGESSCENVRLWCQATDYDFLQLEPRPFPFDASEEITVQQLAAIQMGLHLRQPKCFSPADGQPISLKADNSILWVEAPTHLREMEGLRDLIFHMCDPSHPLYLEGFHPDQACILIADPAAYRPAVELVFSDSVQRRQPLPLRCSIQLRNGNECALGQALLSMIQLVQGEFSRSDVFSLLRNPLVLEAMEFERSDLEAIENLMVELNVYRAMNDLDRQAKGDVRPYVIHTWQHAFDRICSAWMANGPIQGYSPLTSEQVTISHSTPFLSPAAMAEFMQGIKQLFELTQVLRTERNVHLIIRHWQQFMESWIPENFQDRSDTAVASSMKDWLLLLQSSYTVADEEDPEVFLTWLTQWISSELGPDRNARAGKLVIAPLRDSEVIPHRVILVAGLDSQFPGTKSHSAIDLLAGARRVGDANPVAAKKEAMLSVLHAARDRLVLSRRARDIEAERDLAASSMWIELQYFMRDHVLQAETEPTRWCVPLLARESYFAHGEKEKSLLESSTLTLPSLELHEAQLADLSFKDHPQNGEVASSPSPTTALESVSSKVQKIDIKEICEFLESPLDHHLRRRMGLFQQESRDEVLSHHEPLVLGRLQHWGIFQEMTNCLIKHHEFKEDALNQKLQDLITEASHRGELPEPPLEAEFSKELIDLSQSMVEVYTTHIQSLDSSYQRVLPHERTEAWSTGKPLLVELHQKEKIYEVHHHSPPLLYLSPSNASPPLLVSINDSKPSSHGRYLLNLWVSAIWTRAIRGFKGDIRLVHFGVDGGKLGVKELLLPSSNPGTDEALFKSWLKDITTLDRQRLKYQHLPFSAIKGFYEKKGQTMEWDHKDLESVLDDGSSYRPKTEAARLVNSIVPVNAHHIVEERLGSFFQLTPPPSLEEKLDSSAQKKSKAKTKEKR